MGSLRFATASLRALWGLKPRRVVMNDKQWGASTGRFALWTAHPVITGRRSGQRPPREQEAAAPEQDGEDARDLEQ